MKILIATGIYPPDIGGPAQYAKHFAEEFTRQGHKAEVLTYRLEKKLPVGARHLFYFLRAFFHAPWADLIIALDTFSAGLPVSLAAKIWRKKIIVRVGGDFLWESYVDRTGNLITIRDFYEKRRIWRPKEKIVFALTRLFFNFCSAVIFSTDWQGKIFAEFYGLKNRKIYVVENFYGEKIANFGFREKNFLWAGRPNKLKNIENLKIAFSQAKKENHDIKLEITGEIPHQELMKKVQICYAIILPSVSDISPNFILDAIRCDKPFILTRETGFYEKLKNIGIFIDPSDKEDIKEKILFLVNDNNYQEYKKRIQLFTFTHSWQQIAGEFLEIYKKL